MRGAALALAALFLMAVVGVCCASANALAQLDSAFEQENAGAQIEAAQDGQRDLDADLGLQSDEGPSEAASGTRVEADEGSAESDAHDDAELQAESTATAKPQYAVIFFDDDPSGEDAPSSNAELLEAQGSEASYGDGRSEEPDLQSEDEADSLAGGASSSDAQLKVHFLDVGQGDSAFIELPNGETLLIDAGTAPYGEKVVAFVRDKGYEGLDHVLMTHPDADHIGGLIDVVNMLEIGQIYAPNCGHTTQTWENLLDAIAAKGEKIKGVSSGFAMISEKGLSCTIMGPDSIGSDLNNNSAIMLLDYGDIEWLFTGDAESSYILRACSDDIEVLKVSHHGGKGCTTEALVDKLKPEHAVISVGNNSYGHPAGETLEALDGVSVYRTDLSGNITGYSDGRSVWFSVSASAGSAGM